MRFLFLIFMIVPVLEMWLLISIGGWIGALPTIALVLLTAVIGVNLLRQQGMSTFMRAQERLATGSLPALELLEGLALAVGGALLLTPGFATDAFGFACLIPISRQWLAKRAFNFLRERGTLHGVQPMGPDEGPVIIDGEVIDSEPVPPSNEALSEKKSPQQP